MKIPKKIFQTWETKNINSVFKKKIIDTWIFLNPNYTYYLYDNDMCSQFIKENFSLSIYNAYCRIIPGALKADLWRYCILYKYGGVYVDIDTKAFNNIDLFLNNEIEFMTVVDLNNCPTIGTHNLFNTFIASKPEHPILLDCINRIVFNVENNIIPNSNLDFSGPGILGRATNKYLNFDEETSFIGKQGFHDNGKIYLLNFECGTEFVKDVFHDNIIFFQNKNGSSQIQEIYSNEIKKMNNYTDWGKCKNPIKPLPTIVTMIYNIREKEKDQTNCIHNHKIDKYLNLSKQFMLTLQYPIIIFTDDNEIIEFIKNERKNSENITFIYEKKFEDTYFYEYRERLIDLQKKYNILNGSIQHETPLYIILNNNKFYFLEKAIEQNPFNSSHFLWMDFGINHVALNTEIIHDWIFDIPDKIKQLCINPYVENEDHKHFFRYIYHHTAGGLFSGNIENMKKYISLFKKKVIEMYNDDWYQIDEAVMTIVQRENPELFDFFYGDYQGIVSNYLKPLHNLDLIMKGLEKTKNYQRFDFALHIEKYLCLTNLPL